MLPFRCLYSLNLFGVAFQIGIPARGRAPSLTWLDNPSSPCVLPRPFITRLRPQPQRRQLNPFFSFLLFRLVQILFFHLVFLPTSKLIIWPEWSVPPHTPLSLPRPLPKTSRPRIDPCRTNITPYCSIRTPSSSPPPAKLFVHTPCASSFFLDFSPCLVLGRLCANDISPFARCFNLRAASQQLSTDLIDLWLSWSARAPSP